MKPFYLSFSCLQFGPQIRTEGSIVVIDKKWSKLFDAVLSGIPFPFSTLAKSRGARGQLVYFHLLQMASMRLYVLWGGGEGSGHDIAI